MRSADATPGTSLRERHRTRARGDILDAVVQVYAEESGSGAVIEQIATAAGLSRATLYSHFPGGLDELIVAAYESVGEEFLRQTEKRLEGREDWRARIMTHAEVMAAWGTDPHLGVFYNVVAPRFLPSTDDAGVGSSTTRQLAESEITQAQRAGEVAGDIDPVALAAMLTGCVRVIGIEAAQSRSDAAAYVEAFRALLNGAMISGAAGD